MRDDDGDVAQHGGHSPANRMCHCGLQRTPSILDIHFMSIIDTCQNEVSADQYLVSILSAQVLSSLRSHVSLKLTADQVLAFSIGSWAQTRLTYCNQGGVVLN